MSSQERELLTCLGHLQGGLMSLVQLLQETKLSSSQERQWHDALQHALDALAAYDLLKQQPGPNPGARP